MSQERTARLIERYGRECVTVREAARELGISESGYRTRAYRHELPMVKVGHRAVVPIDALARVMDGQAVQP